MNGLKATARDWIPPALLRAWRAGQGGGIRFEGPLPTWDEARSRCTGYGESDILDRVLDATLRVRRGEAVFERDSVLFRDPEYPWPVVAGLLWAAALGGGTLRVLDFGGSLGSSWFQCRRILSTLREVRWNVVEQPHFVEAGRAKVQNDHLRFHLSVEECVAEGPPDVVLLSSVLQYLPDPATTLASLVEVGAPVLIVDRTIVNPGDGDRVYVQHVPASIYPASYPVRSLARSRLLEAITPRYALVAGFPSLPFQALASIGSTFEGFLFARSP